jgi:hypothetical protein
MLTNRIVAQPADSLNATSGRRPPEVMTRWTRRLLVGGTGATRAASKPRPAAIWDELVYESCTKQERSQVLGVAASGFITGSLCE